MDFVDRNEILIFTTGLSMLIFIMFPVEAYIKKIFKISLGKFLLISIVTLIFFVDLFLQIGFSVLTNLVLVLLGLWAFLFGINTHRKLIYTTALFLLVLSGIFFLIKLEKLSQYIATLFFLLFVLGFIKDFIYDKVFEE